MFSRHTVLFRVLQRSRTKRINIYVAKGIYYRNYLITRWRSLTTGCQKVGKQLKAGKLVHFKSKGPGSHRPKDSQMATASKSPESKG